MASSAYDIDLIPDPDQRKAFGQALVRLSSHFLVTPRFGFYTDDGHPNAQAIPDSAGNPGQCTVVFGDSLFRDQISRYNDNGLSIIAICAHEFGHVVQFTRGVYEALMQNQSTVKLVELHADFLAGYYLAYLKRLRPQLKVWSVGDTFNRIGDTMVWDRNHHGTPEERVSAAEAGYKLGSNDNIAIYESVEQGVGYVRNL